MVVEDDALQLLSSYFIFTTAEESERGCVWRGMDGYMPHTMCHTYFETDRNAYLSGSSDGTYVVGLSFGAAPAAPAPSSATATLATSFSFFAITPTTSPSPPPVLLFFVDAAILISTIASSGLTYGFAAVYSGCCTAGVLGYRGVGATAAT